MNTVLHLPFTDQQVVMMFRHGNRSNRTMEREEPRVKGTDIEEPRKALAKLKALVALVEGRAPSATWAVYDCLVEIHDRIDRVREMLGG